MLFQIILLASAVAIAVPCFVMLIECVGAAIGSRKLSSRRPWLAQKDTLERTITEGPEFSLAVIMPAHNEADVISNTISLLTPYLYPQDQLIVVADNCTDQTARLAREAGATVVERTDSLRRGKGYALDYGLKSLADHPPAAVVVVDADCQFRTGAPRQLATEAIAYQRPVQAVYLIDRPQQPSLKEAISSFAFKVKNLVRPLGLSQFEVPCLLTGTGMAFPWKIASSMELASSSIVEDMKLGFDLAIAGFSPVLCPSVTVVGPLPPNDEAAETQRTRWEHGHLNIIGSYVPKLLGQALRQGRVELLALAFDLLIPPLSLLVMIWLCVSASITLVGLLTGFWWPAEICLVAGIALFVGVGIAWNNFARADLSLKVLLSAPLYVLWKVPLYLKALTKPQVDWVRTKR